MLYLLLPLLEFASILTIFWIVLPFCVCVTNWNTPLNDNYIETLSFRSMVLFLSLTAVCLLDSSVAKEIVPFLLVCIFHVSAYACGKTIHLLLSPYLSEFWISNSHRQNVFQRHNKEQNGEESSHGNRKMFGFICIILNS